MIGILVASLVGLAGQATSISAILQKPRSNAPTVLFPLARVRELTQPFATESELTRSEEIVGYLPGKGFTCYQWDSQELLPQVPNAAMYESHGRMMAAFDGLFSDQRTDLFGQLSGGKSALMGEFPKGKVDALVDALPDYSNEIKQSIKSGGQEIRASFQPKLILQGRDGQYLTEIDLSKCPAARKALEEIFGNLPEAAPVARCPATLRGSFVSGMALPVDGTRVFRVEELVAALRKGTNMPLYADRRILTKRVAIRSTRVSLGTLAEALPSALNMYWRPVGSVWFLAISPGDPVQEATIRASQKFRQSGDRIAARLAQAGYLPSVSSSNGFLGRAVSLADLNEAQARAFTEVLVNCADDARRNSVSEALRGRKLSDLNIVPALGVDINLSVPGIDSWFSIYVQYP